MVPPLVKWLSALGGRGKLLPSKVHLATLVTVLVIMAGLVGAVASGE